jgi:hydrogenase small subunit
MNVDNFTATLVHYLTFGKLPAMDDLGRPLFAYGRRIHDNCERRGHFDAGEFVREWGDEGHRNGWCLYQMGCKGPVAFHNCPTIRWNQGTSWPVASGHGCIACAAPDFWEAGAYETTPIFDAAPPTAFPETAVGGQKVDLASAGVGVAAGVAAGVIGTIAAKKLTSK